MSRAHAASSAAPAAGPSAAPAAGSPAVPAAGAVGRAGSGIVGRPGGGACGGGAAREDALARRGVGGPGRVVRPGDGDALHERLRAREAAGVAGHPRVRERLADLLDESRRLLVEGHPDLAGAGRHPEAEVDGGRLRVGVVGRPVGGRAEGERLDGLAVDGDLEVVALAQTPGAGELDAEVVARVLREQVVDVEAAPGAERQRLDPGVLGQVLGRLVGVGGHGRGRAAHREPRDGAGGGEVALHERLRHAEDAADVVEAEARVVGGEEVVGVEIDRQQVAHRVAVLGAVQTVEGGGTPGVAGGGPRAVELALEPVEEAVEGGRRGPGPPGRGHDAAPQLADDLLPLGGVAADVVEVEGVEGQGHRAELPHERRRGAPLAVHHALVVAGDAVAVEQGAVGGGRRGFGGAGGRGGLPGPRAPGRKADDEHRGDERHETGLRHDVVRGGPGPRDAPVPQRAHASMRSERCQRTAGRRAHDRKARRPERHPNRRPTKCRGRHLTNLPCTPGRT